MSTSPSQESVEETKRQIRTLVNEISEMSKTDMPADDYYPAVLQRVVSALAAVGGAIWEIENNGLKLRYQIRLDESLIESESEDANAHLRLLSRVAGRNQAELIPPNSGFGDESGASNPTGYLLVLSPLVSGKQLNGIIEIFQRPDSPPETQRGYLRFLEHMSKLIGDWMKGQSLQLVSDRQQLWQQSDQFARIVHDNLDLRDTAYTIANEGRRLIECDRVSLAITKGNKAKVIAISGQDSIENRSNIVVALNRLASRVVRSGEPMWYDGSTEDLPPQLEEAVEDYVDLSHGRSITVLPIHRPERIIEGDVEAKKKDFSEIRRNEEIIGALIVEQIETQIPRKTIEGRIDLVYEHTCRALANTLSFEHLFLMPVWRLLGRGMWLFRGSALPKTLAVLGLIAVGLLAMFLVKIDFDLEGDGALQPLVQRNVFAQIDGEVDQVLVEHSQRVEKDQPVVILRNRDLDLQIQNAFNQYQNALTKASQLQAQASVERLPEQERTRLYSEQADYNQQVKSAASELQLLQYKKEQLTRRSPINGIVTSWEVQKNLQARPVSATQVLMTIADTNSDYVVDVNLPEKRMQYLDEAMKEAEANGQDYLPVEFICMTKTSQTQTGKLYRVNVHQRAEVLQEEGTVVKLRIVPDSLEGITPFPGAKVKANVKCGKASAAFVWFHEVVEWIRANLLF